MKMGKTLHPTPYTLHPTPCPHEKLFRQTLLKYNQEKLSNLPIFICSCH
ncbi:hypothetical protein [Microcystis sp.]